MKRIRIPDQNFQGGGTGTGSSLETLSDFELAGLAGSDVNSPNTILDTYNSLIATLANVELVQSSVKLQAGQNTGTVEHELNVSANLDKVTGGLVVSMHSAQVQSVSSNDLVVLGDATNLFLASERVMIMRRQEQLDRTTHAGLVDNSNNIARLEVASASYSSVNDETTITLTNPDTLDLTMGIAANDIPNELLIAPFDWDLEASATGTGAYEEMDVVDLHGIDRLRLEGSNFFEIMETLPETMEKVDGAMSENGQYGIIRVLANSSGNDTYHYYYSTDRGNSWNKFSRTDSVGIDFSDDGGSSPYLLHPGQIKVANNGLFIMGLTVFSGGGFKIRGRRGDLTDLTPTVLDTPDIGLGSGAIYDGGTDNTVQMAIDKENLDHVTFLVGTDSGQAIARTFTAGGATHNTDTALENNVAWAEPIAIETFFTGAHWENYTAWRHNVNGTLTVRSFGTDDHLWSSGLSIGSDEAVMGSAGKLGRLYLLVSTASEVRIVNVDMTPGLPVVLANYNTQSFGTRDNIIGNGSNSIQNFWRTLPNTVAVDPLDDQHVFFTFAMNSPNSSTSATVWEIKDIENFTGLVQFNASSNTNANHRNNSGAVYTAQTFTAPQDYDLKTISLRIANSADKLDGTIKLRIEDTIGNAPIDAGGTNLGESLEYDLSRLHAVNGSDTQWVHFTFPTPVALTNGVTYTFILESTFPVDATDFLNIDASSANPVGGSTYQADAALTWAVAAGFDLVYFIHDVWLDLPGFGGKQGGGLLPYFIQDAEPQIKIKDNNEIDFYFNRIITAGSLPDFKYRGVPFKSTYTISGTSDKSDFTDPTCAAYAEGTLTPEFDRNLRLNLSLGDDLAKKRDGVSGVLNTDVTSDQGRGINDLGPSAFAHSSPAGSWVIPADADFQSGTCIEFNGTDRYIDYGHHNALEIGRGENEGAFTIEAEIKIDNFGASSTIISKFRPDSGIEAGWSFTVTNTGNLEFFCYDETSTLRDILSTAGLFTINQLYKVRVSRAGNGEDVRLFTSTGAALTAGPNGESVFTEVSYSTQDSFNEIANPTGRSLYVGVRDTSNAGGVQLGEYMRGRIGYVKYNIGSESFAYHGFKNNSPVTTMQAMGGDVALGKQFRGESDGTHLYYEAGVMKDGKPLVDSYDIFLKCEKTLAAAGNQLAIRATHKRPDESIQSSEQGRIFTFTK